MMFPSTTSTFWILLLILAGAAIPFVASHTTNSTANVDDEYILPRLPLPKYNEKGEILFFPRIVGGSVAGLGEYPGKVSLQQRNGNHFCGGTIIDQTHVVTAAHCVTNDRAVVINPSLIQVQGDDLLITSQGSPSRQIRRVSHIFVHTQYSVRTLQNDIAVLRLETPFNRTNTFYPIFRAASTPPNNKSCSVAGWGATYINGSASSQLLRVNQDIIALSICNRSYSNMLRSGMLCAGFMAGGRDSCQGDSGGGLICDNLLAGVVSFGNGCALPNYPGIYTDVSVYNGFIDSAIRFVGSHSAVPTPRPGAASALATTSVYLMLLLSAFIFLINK